ncbi:MAG: hypothetical protein AAGA65_16975, partial [Actinomycetota bacterium]
MNPLQRPDSPDSPDSPTTTAASRRPTRRRKLLVGAVTLLLTLSAWVATTAPAADAASFEGWEYTPQVSSTRSDGLALNDVSYNGLKIFERISLPAMNVFYDNNVCGPYVDRIGGTRYTTEGPTEFTQNGVRWLQIGLTDQIGAYVITQMFYLSENGDFDAHIFSKGLQCNIRHDHIPFWRIDFDLAQPGNDVIRRATNGGMVDMRQEFSMSATAAVDHGWEVRDAATGDVVTVRFDDGNFGLPGEVIPETNYLTNNVYGRQYRSSEQRWQGGATYGLFGDESETITDAVLWYSGYLPHSPEEGPSLWHSTGIRMKVVPARSQSATITGRVIDGDGGGWANAQVDLFSENRSSWLGAAFTDGSGRFTFEVNAGCYVLTYIAPDGASFNGSQYRDRTVCVDAGQTSDGNEEVAVTPGGGAASVGDRVTYSDGSPAAGVVVDLFSENRATWLGSTTTDADGRYSFALGSARCGVVTFVAPSGQTFVDTGGAYKNAAFCVVNGQDLTTVDAVLSAPGGQASLGDRVTNAANGAGVSGVKIVLYRASGDGSRGQWVRDTTTNGSG